MVNSFIKVAVSGAGGRMGREVVKMVLNHPEFELVAAIDRASEGVDAGSLVGLKECGVKVVSDLELALVEAKPDVLVDFTIPQTVLENTKTAIKHKVRPVIGTTGFKPEDIEELDKQCREQGIGGIIAPNFSIGAILMMKFAAQAAKYMPHVEIIEYHGDQKLDAPSGTAVKTAEWIAQNRRNSGRAIPGKRRPLKDRAAGYTTGFAYIA